MKLIACIMLLAAPFCAGAQVINTYAGNGITGYSGDGGPAVAAQFQELVGVAADDSGNVYIPDYNNNVIRRVDNATRIINTIAGTGTPGYSGDGGPATAAKLNHPWNIALDDAGNIYVSEQGNHTIRKITSTGIISTIAGNGTAGYSGNGGPATAAQLNMPWGIAVSDPGNIYVADGGNDVVRNINSSGVITVVAGTGTLGYNGDGIDAKTAQLSNPSGLAWHSGNLYIADNLNNRIRKVNSSGIISTVAGSGTIGYNGDGGYAIDAAINSPQGVCVTAAGNIIFSDFGNSVIRKVSVGTVISTLAGTGIGGYSGDGGNPLLAKLYNPWGVAVDATNKIYIADKNNYRIREVYTLAAGIEGMVQNTFSVYPNPATTQLTVKAGATINSVRIVNLLGQEVYSKQCNSNETQLDIASLSPGIYMMTLNNAMYVRFIKQ